MKKNFKFPLKVTGVLRIGHLGTIRQWNEAVQHLRDTRCNTRYVCMCPTLFLAQMEALRQAMQGTSSVECIFPVCFVAHLLGAALSWVGAADLRFQTSSVGAFFIVAGVSLVLVNVFLIQFFSSLV